MGCRGIWSNMFPGFLLLLSCASTTSERCPKRFFFSTIDEMLMRLYYLYEKSPKVSRAK